MLSPKEIESIKNQIISQIDKTFPEDKKEQAKQQIRAMNEEELENFLSQNNLVKKSEENSNPFRAIVEKKIPSKQIDENQYAIAVLEINPISKGHCLIIPKKPLNPTKKIPKYIEIFTKKIIKNLNSNLKPKKVEQFNTNLFDELIINLIPIYSNETKESPRKRANEEELEELKNYLTKKKKIVNLKKKIPEKIKEEKLWLPKRIP